ncbi:hypothetical protein [Qipengyuania sp.]|uniref:hypothetical protein n=1 Tax=Qipengyuania sp. TaxID=2004515 RepID=UPI003AF4F676
MVDKRLYFNVEERRAEKQKSREEDARRLAAGEVTKEELGRENRLFSSPIISNMRIFRRFGNKTEPPSKK